MVACADFIDEDVIVGRTRLLAHITFLLPAGPARGRQSRQGRVGCEFTSLCLLYKAIAHEARSYPGRERQIVRS